MPHVTFIHGIANKPPKDQLLKDWEDSLTQGGLNLAGHGVTTSMVYWADVMYAEPETSATSYESVDDGLGTEDEDEDMDWIEGLSGSEAEFVALLREKIRFDAESPGGDNFEPPAPKSGDEESGSGPIEFEAIPLPWFIKRRVMKRLLKDVHHYLFNSTYSPRPGDEYQVKDHIRKLFVDQLKEDSANNTEGTHIVVSHSMGTVVSYDCLKNVSDCPNISGYMTVGSPLGISEVFDNLKPGYSRNDGFPSASVAGGWVNVFDRLDPVAFDAHISNDYQKGGSKVVDDQRVRNSGRWRHSSWKYFGQPVLCNHLAKLLDL